MKYSRQEAEKRHYDDLKDAEETSQHPLPASKIGMQARKRALREGRLRSSATIAAEKMQSDRIAARKAKVEAKNNPVENVESVDTPMLLGSSIQPAVQMIGGREVSLGEIVAAAHEASGLSVDEWNSLEEKTTEELIVSQIQKMGGTSGDPENNATQPVE